MSTGYQAILLVRQLVDGKTIDHILNNFPIEKQQIIEEFQLNIEKMKQTLGDVRDQWIKDDLNDWVGKNPLFPGIVEKLQNLSKLGDDWYIVTTKQERFVKQILKANNIQVADERIFGLDRQRTKVETLTDLVSLHSQQKVCFVEDMLSALMKVANKKELNSINLFLAGWGYNTRADKLAARAESVEVIDMEQFLV
jgi:phosphoglycolate phosphatase-like HAD superfamily hydrolase